MLWNIVNDFIRGLLQLLGVLEQAAEMLEGGGIVEAVAGTLVKCKRVINRFAVNRLAAAGVPFREAYRQVGAAIQEGSFQPSPDLVGPDGKVTASSLGHTHIGSTGNLCNDKIAARMDAVLARFPFERVRSAMEAL